MPLRYAVLHHTGIPSPHYDLMFETAPGSDLATWRVEHWPIESSQQATRLKDHRRAYLEFEGELTQRRGHVERVAAGTCTIEVGENARWRVTIRSGGSSQKLLLEQQDKEQWTVHPE
jgi:hypothetical protein